jgi:hypothetical protein
MRDRTNTDSCYVYVAVSEARGERG